MDELRMLIASNEPDIMMFTEVIPKAQKKPIPESQVKLTGACFNLPKLLITISFSF